MKPDDQAKAASETTMHPILNLVENAPVHSKNAQRNLRPIPGPAKPFSKRRHSVLSILRVQLRKIRGGWRESDTIVHKLSVPVLVISTFVSTISLLFDLRSDLGGPPVVYFVVAGFLLILALVVLLAITFVKIGEQSRELKHREKDYLRQRSALERKYQTFISKSLYRRLALCTSFHNLSHVIRDLTINGTKQPCPAEVCGALVASCDVIEKLFNKLFDGRYRFRVAVKALVDENNVMTLARDTKTTRSLPNGYDKKRFNVHHETSFRHLLSAEQTVFACDSLATEPQYVNSTPDRRDRYNATMVVPIRRSRIDRENKFELAGYLAIDCKTGKAHEDIFCHEREPDAAFHNLLLAFADAMFGIIKRGRVVAPTGLDTGAYASDQSNYGFAKEVHEVYVSATWKHFELIEIDDYRP